MFDTTSRALLASLAALSLVTACDSDDPGPSVPGLALKLYTPSGAADPYAGVGWIRLVLTGDGLTAPFILTQPYSPGGSASLEGVPFSLPGQRRRLMVEGLSDAGGQPGFVISRGRSPEVEIQAGSALQEFEVLFARVNSFAQLTSTTTRAAQRLVTPRVGHAVTVTAGEIVVSGGGTFTAGTSPWWTGAGFQAVSTSVEAISRRTRDVAPRTEMLVARTWHTGTALPSGQVIFAGGFGADGQPTSTVELHNPPGILDAKAIGLLPLATPRAGHSATMIDEEASLILFVGGDATGTWELWDPNTGSRGLQQLPDGRIRRHHQATTFYVPGRTEPAVLISGGESFGTPTATVHNNIMLYDSVANSLIPLEQVMPGGPRTQHSAVYVPARNFIYIAGGFGDIGRQTTVPSIDVFDIAQTRLLEGQSGFRMRSGRGGHAAVLLSDNLVFMAGGLGEEPPGTGMRPLGSLEVIYEFIDTTSLTLRIEVASSWNPNGVGQVPYLPTDRVGHRVVNLDGMALVIG
ncbi:MAG TPA: kelch repeat-containing protein, partial [Myxococcota bacterium]|nr:kelch repeat-containing protein [Myxococcota bacterium]